MAERKYLFTSESVTEVIQIVCDQISDAILRNACGDPMLGLPVKRL